MPLTTGTRLGQYEILGPLGAGGMGEVYRARDTKLNRDVAVKVLPEAVANDRERLARFAREAQALAALNHPNIATIYGVEDGATQAIVMELVEGLTLADLMIGAADRAPSGREPRPAAGSARHGKSRRVALPLDQALAIARQIADALEAAHSRGIVHRDLKPANVKITPEGAVKVLDFGLAKAAAGRDSTSSDSSNSPTFTAASSEGMIVGTAAYMSPEQAAGQATDTRADVWAFGVVLFEMLSGSPLFSGETTGHILAEVLKSDPAWEALPRTTPPEVRGLLERCLRKNARSRLRDIGDARVEIEDWLARPEKTRFVAPPPAAGRHPRWTLALVAASLVAVTAAGLAIWRRPATIVAPARAWEFELGDYENRFPDYYGPVISPDGLMIAFDGNGRGRLRVRDIDTLAPRELPGTDGAYQPFWSPDSAFIGYYVAQASRLSVWKVPAHSGAPTKICDAPPGLLWPSAWRPDGVIILNAVDGPQAGALYTVSDRGGTPAPLTIDGSEKGDAVFSPVALPSGDLLYSRWRKGAYELVVGGKSGPRALVKETAILTPLSFRDGYFLYSSGSGLWARAYDPASATLVGEPLVIAPGGAFQSASLSADGTLVYRTMTGGSQQLQWVDRAGVVLGPIGQAQEAIGDPTISPDGSRVAATGSEGRVTSIWTHDIARGTRSRVTVGSGYQRQPSWAPGGDRLAFESNWDVFVQAAADSAGQPQLVAGGSVTQWSPTWSHDGRTLFFTQSGPAQNDIMFQTLGDGSAAQVFLATPYNEYDARPSPDGRHVAYASDESGRNEIYVREFPGGQGTKLISMRGGTAPRWSPKGDELFFVADDTLMAVSVKLEPRFSAGLPQPLFTATKVGLDSSQGFAYDVAADGRRFIVVRTITRPERHAVVIENWVAKARAGR
jgi:eukaryotic-like serine/threonine-protein kinase